jgi:hypothetical protein
MKIKQAVQLSSDESARKAATLPAAEPARRGRDAANAPGSLPSREDQLEDSPAMVAQRKEIEAAFGAAAVQQDAAGTKESADSSGVLQRLEDVDEEQTLQGKFDRAATGQKVRVGMPEQLKTGVEALSGLSMDHVQVHYNSAEPAQLNARAYARGSEIHLGPGQEQHLPHEAWHVVQQARGRVQPTTRTKAGVRVNDDAALEAEANAKGAMAQATGSSLARSQGTSAASGVAQLSGGSTKANEELVRAMGRAAALVDHKPEAKPHTTTGTGAGGSEAHQRRNARVINKAKMDTIKAGASPTTFSASVMRAESKSAGKGAAAAEKRKAKKGGAKALEDAQIRKLFGLEDGEEITKDHRDAFREIGPE